MVPEPDSQSAVIAFLGDPASYGAGVDRVDVIETHISLVFLADDRVYKLKRARQISLCRLLWQRAAPASLRGRALAEPAHRARSLP
jgi:hypothetical protein